MSTGVVHEIARVLAPGGVLAVCVTHPIADAGRFAERRGDAPFVIDGSYLGQRPFLARIKKNGVEMSFAGWARDISTYFQALGRAGLVVEQLDEPGSTPELVASDPAEARWLRIPNFLFLRALKPRGEMLSRT